MKCYFCGVGLKNFMHHDDPWEEHARWSPNCIYLKIEKGETYIKHVSNIYIYIYIYIYICNYYFNNYNFYLFSNSY